MVSNEQWLVANLFFEDEVDGQNKAGEAHKVVPFKTLVHEDNHKEGEHRERDNLLDNLQLPDREWATILCTSQAVCRDHKAVLKERYKPTDGDNCNHANALKARLKHHLTIPGKCHKEV